jgi:hypothetical protein
MVHQVVTIPVLLKGAQRPPGADASDVLRCMNEHEQPAANRRLFAGRARKYVRDRSVAWSDSYRMKQKHESDRAHRCNPGEPI